MPCGIFQPNGDVSDAVDDEVVSVDSEGGLLLTIEGAPSNDDEVKNCCNDNNMTEFNNIINIVVDTPNDEDERPVPPESVLLFAMLITQYIS